VEPVARPRTVALPAALRARMSLSISRATYFEAASALANRKTGVRVWSGMQREHEFTVTDGVRKRCCRSWPQVSNLAGP